MNLQGSAGHPLVRLTPNLFGIAFTFAGLAQCWSTAAGLINGPSWPGNVLWIFATIVWCVLLELYISNVLAGGRERTELEDPIFAPFVSLIFIVPMLFAVTLTEHERGFGETVFIIAFVLMVAVGAWLTGQWIIADMKLTDWHPGYFLPTVAGGLVAAGAAASIGYNSLAKLMFGYGAICWLLLGSIILLRLFTQPTLAPGLIPTIAIELAPPVVAGNAWFLLNGDRLDTVALILAGYAALMVLVQLRLLPIYLRTPFGPGTWAFGFSYAAAVTVAIRWLAVEHVHGQRALTYILLALITIAVAALAARTVVLVRRGTYFPQPVPPPSE